MRGYGADWTLTQYFVWYYLEYGKRFRPEDIYAGNLLGGDRGDRRRRDHDRRLVARAADRRARRRRRRRAARRCPAGSSSRTATSRQGPWEWSAQPEVRRLPRATARRRPTTCSASRWPSTSPATPPSPRGPRSRWPASWAAGHHARRRLGRHQRRRHPAHARERFHDARDLYVHAATLDSDSYQRIAATGGSRLGVDGERAERGAGLPAHLAGAHHDIPVSLSMDTSVWWSGDLFSAMRTHARRRPGPRAPGGARRRGDGHVVAPARRAGGRVGDPRRRRGLGPG